MFDSVHDYFRRRIIKHSKQLLGKYNVKQRSKTKLKSYFGVEMWYWTRVDCVDGGEGVVEDQATQTDDEAEDQPSSSKPRRPTSFNNGKTIFDNILIIYKS